MNPLRWKKRLLRTLFIALCSAYTLTGLVFISTRSPGGVSLGLLFLGGAALLYLGICLLDELGRIRLHLAVQTEVLNLSSNQTSTLIKKRKLM